jgi:hypothetical protein
MLPGVKAAGAYGCKPYHLHVPIVLKSGSLNLLEPSGPVQACNGDCFTFLPTYTVIYTILMYDSVHSPKHFNIHDDIRIGSITAFRQLVLCFWFIYCDIFTFYVPDSNHDRTRNRRNLKLFVPNTRLP